MAISGGGGGGVSDVFGCFNWTRIVLGRKSAIRTYGYLKDKNILKRQKYNLYNATGRRNIFALTKMYLK